MADNQGFLSQLTGGDVDEAANAKAIIGEDIKQGGRLAQMQYGLGRQAGGSLGVLGAGLLAGGMKGRFGIGDKSKSFKENFTTAAEDAETSFVASVNGISGNELKARRAIRKEMASDEYKDDGTHAARIKMAKRAIQISNELGDAAGVARGLETLKALEVEDVELSKLKSGAKSAAAKATEDGIKTGYTAEGKPVTGVLSVDEQGRSGLNTTVDGQLTFKPFNGTFSLEDPTKDALRGRQERTVGQRLRDIATPTELTKIRSLASSANSALSRTDRILSSMSDSANGGGVESMIGTSGGLITSIDNFARNINGVIGAFASEGSSKDNNNLRSGLGRRAKDADDFLSQFVVLPEGVERTSAAAQQHRANVMEMAYMAARLAEPSNRGLSDNDIKNALTRIAGDTSNPQVMMRRFLEMQVDAADELDFGMKMFHGSLDGVSDERIDSVIGGKAVPEYRKRKADLFEKFGVERKDAGRIVFGEGFALGADVQPGEAVLNNGGPGTAPAEELDDDGFLNSVLGTPEEVE
jgi:hypothetical protein